MANNNPTYISSVKFWAEKYGLNEEVEILLTNGFNDLTKISFITENDLNQIGITKIGTRKKLLFAAGEIKKKVMKLFESGGSLADLNLAYSDPSTLTEPPKVAEVNPLELRGEELIDYYEIRKATLIDIPQITAIYNYYVVNNIGLTGEDKELSEEAFVTKFYSLGTRHPILVVSLTQPLGHYPVGFIGGYAMSPPYSNKSTTAHVVMGAMYIHHEFKSKGIGFPLAVIAEECCYQNGFEIALNTVADDNKASIGIIQKMGFNKVAEYKGIQNDRGKRFDVFWFQKDIRKDREKDYPTKKLIISAIHQTVVTVEK